MTVLGRIRAAKLDNSPRLQKALQFLLAQHGGWVTTRAIMRGAHVCAVNTVIAELRANGCQIECKLTVAPGGQRRFYYRLTAAPEGWA